MNIPKTLATLAMAALAVLSISTAQANVISGSVFAVPDATAADATPANVPGGAPDVTFDVNSPLNFDLADASVGDWLTSGGAFNVVGSAAALARLMSDGVTGTLVVFSGSVSVVNGQVFNVTHDDGLTLVIGGLTVVDEPGPTPPTVTADVYTGPDGTFPFLLVYGECCTGPAVLQVDLPFTNVPEPASIAILGFALVGLGAVRRKRAA